MPQVVTRDISVFATLYTIFFCTFGLPTYIAYPRIGKHYVGYHPNFNAILGSLHELNELALLGESDPWVASPTPLLPHSIP